MNFERITATGCRIDDVQNNDQILIGGGLGELSQAVTVDIDNFEEFFQRTEAGVTKLINNGVINDMNRLAPDFNDVDAYAHMLAFNMALDTIYPGRSDNLSDRNSYYDKEGSKKLSQVFNDGVCACAEMAILAQAYFQRQGFETKYMGGEIVKPEIDEHGEVKTDILGNVQTEEFGEAHSFISIRRNNEEYFYDPANPIRDINNPKFCRPKILSIQATPYQKQQFENKIHSSGDRCAFLETRDVISGSRAYYGFGDGGNISPNNIFSKNNKLSLSSFERNM